MSRVQKNQTSLPGTAENAQDVAARRASSPPDSVDEADASDGLDPAQDGAEEAPPHFAMAPLLFASSGNMLRLDLASTG
jgi:hypothetical protein